MPNDFNDDLDDLFTAGPTSTPKRLVTLPENYVSPEVTFSEGCPKCRGTGRFTSWSGRQLGECFACKGKGSKTFKSSSADRAKARDQAAIRKDTKVLENIRAFEAAEPAVWAWLKSETTKVKPFEFAVAMVETVVKFGSMTEKQLETSKRLAQAAADRKAKWAAEKAATVQAAPAVETAGVDYLKAAFDKAVAFSAEKGLKLSPRITMGGLTISPAKATSANPGALYVKASGGERTYLGKIVNGQFFGSRECSPGEQDTVLALLANPKQAAEVYGQTTGTCCICNATLISKWKEKGIGPICAQKFGWA